MLTLTLISLLCAADAGPVDAGVKGADAGVVLADAGMLAGAVGAPKLTPEVKALVDRVQSFYEKTADFTAGVEQRYAYTASKRTQTSTGQVTFKKPALMRWEYEKPSKKTFVLAGQKIYAYDPEAKLLTVAAIGTNSSDVRSNAVSWEERSTNVTCVLTRSVQREDVYIANAHHHCREEEPRI